MKEIWKLIGYWLLTIICVIFGVIYFSLWINLRAHGEGFMLFILTFMIFILPYLIFIKLIIRFDYKQKKLEFTKIKFLILMGKIFLGLGVFLLFLSLFIVYEILKYPSSAYDIISIFFLLIYFFLLILLGVFLIKYFNKFRIKKKKV